MISFSRISKALPFCLLIGQPYSTLSAAAVPVEKATFGAGCFWGTQRFYDTEFPDLISSQVGYMGGTLEDPSYDDVCMGHTGHAEVVQLEFAPTKTDYGDLLNLFFSHHDPTTVARQGNDVGTQYRSVIFYHTAEQKARAEATIKQLEETKFGGPGTIVSEIVDAADHEFYPAESYHQNYLAKNPGGYCNHFKRWD